MTEEFSSPLSFCGEILWGQDVKYYYASDNPQHVYLSYSDNKNQIAKFSLQDRSLIWRTNVEGEVLGIFDLVKKNEVQVLSSNNYSLFLTKLNVESGISVSQNVYLRTNFNILNSINKKEFILINKLSLQFDYFGYIGKSFKSLDLTSKNLSESTFQINGNRIYLLEDNQLTTFNLSEIGDKNVFSSINKSGITEVNVSDEMLYIGFNNGEVSALGIDLKTVWKIKTGGKVRFIKNIGHAVLVISDDNFIYLFTKKNGNLEWKFRNKNRLLVTPTIIGKNIFIFDILDNSLKILSLNKGVVINQLFLKERKLFEGEIIYKDKRLYLMLPDRILFYSMSKC